MLILPRGKLGLGAATLSAGLGAHTTTASIVLPQWVPYLANAGQYLGAVAVVYYGFKALILLLATIVGIFTKDQERGQRCVQIVQAVSRGWSWPPRLPGSPR
jgi:hypothetical protein